MHDFSDYLEKSPVFGRKLVMGKANLYSLWIYLSQPGVEPMKNLILVTLLLLVPQFAAARVYMCVDQATGQTSFTDKACDTASVREEIKVPPSNLDSGERDARPSQRKTWRSQADVRKTGADYNAERRSVYESKVTAAAR
jgi:hypothetical protein